MTEPPPDSLPRRHGSLFRFLQAIYILKMLKYNFPERMYKLFFVRESWLFWALWKVGDIDDSECLAAAHDHDIPCKSIVTEAFSIRLSLGCMRAHLSRSMLSSRARRQRHRGLQQLARSRAQAGVASSMSNPRHRASNPPPVPGPPSPPRVRR